jgi:hypothetical protein
MKNLEILRALCYIDYYELRDHDRGCLFVSNKHILFICKANKCLHAVGQLGFLKFFKTWNNFISKTPIVGLKRRGKFFSKNTFLIENGEQMYYFQYVIKKYFVLVLQ